jgi:hypothetical protein
MGKSIKHKINHRKSSHKKSKTRKRNTSMKHGGKITKKSMVGSAIKSIASFVDIKLNDNDINDVYELASSPEAEKIEKTALDVAEDVPVVGEGVGLIRTASDAYALSETAEKAVSSVNKIGDAVEKTQTAVSSISDTISDNEDLYNTVKKHHVIQGKILDRISQSKENFAQSAPTQDSNQNYNPNQNYTQNQDQNQNQNQN